jgi:predicted nuclease of predicted toxin-antitoxin system
MVALLADENFPLPVLHALRALGHDVHTLHDYGHSGQALPDPEVLALATAQQRALLTLNRRDFIRLHLQNAAHAGIIVCTFDADFVGQAQRIATALTAQPILIGQLLRVNRESSS